MSKIFIITFCFLYLDVFGLETLTLQEAIQRGLHHSFGLKKASIEVSVADANAYHSYLLPNPQFSLNVETSSFMHDHNDDPSIAYGIGQMFEPWKKRRYRREVAAAQQGAAEANFAYLKWDTILNIKQAYVHALIAKQQAQIAIESKELQEKLYQTAVEKSAMGRLSMAEKIKAESCFQVFDIECKKKMHLYENAKLELGYLIGIVEDEFELDEEVLLNFETPNIYFSESDNTFLKVKNWEIEASLQQVAFEEAKKTPDIALNAGIFHEQDKVQPSGLFFGISFALPIFDKNESAIAKAQLALAKQELEKEEYLHKLQLELRKKQLSLNQTYEELLCYHDCILVKANECYQNVADCYECGKIDMIDLLRAKQTCLEYKEKYLEVYSRYYALLIEMQKLAGKPAEM